jgi:hypothetical protein
LSRFEGEFIAAEDVSLDAADLLGLLRNDATRLERQQAIACFLAGAEGWQDALKSLGGAFAADAAAAVRLNGDKAE